MTTDQATHTIRLVVLVTGRVIVVTTAMAIAVEVPTITTITTTGILAHGAHVLMPIAIVQVLAGEW